MKYFALSSSKIGCFLVEHLSFYPQTLSPHPQLQRIQDWDWEKVCVCGGGGVQTARSVWLKRPGEPHLGKKPDVKSFSFLWQRCKSCGQNDSCGDWGPLDSREPGKKWLSLRVQTIFVPLERCCCNSSAPCRCLATPSNHSESAIWSHLYTAVSLAENTFFLCVKPLCGGFAASQSVTLCKRMLTVKSRVYIAIHPCLSHANVLYRPHCCLLGFRKTQHSIPLWTSPGVYLPNKQHSEAVEASKSCEQMEPWTNCYLQKREQKLFILTSTSCNTERMFETALPRFSKLQWCLV